MADIPTILEDQVFSLNLLRLATRNGHQMSQSTVADLFLSVSEIQNCQDQQMKQLFSLDPKQEEEESLAVSMRAVCNCLSLLTYVSSQEMQHLDPDKIHTLQDVDKAILTVMQGWSTLSCTDLQRVLKRLVDFLVFYGSLHVLPDGVHSHRVTCVLCKFAVPLDTDMPLNSGCSHYVAQRPFSSGPVTTTDWMSSLFDQDQEEDEIFSHRELSRLREQKKKLFQLRNMIVDLKVQYSDRMSEMHFVSSLKCVSPYLYGLVARYTLFLMQRLHNLHMFHHPSNGLSIREALQRHGIPLVDIYSERLTSCLKRVTLSKTNMRFIHENFESLLLDPVSLHCTSEKLLRVSIIARQFCLSLGMSPQEVLEHFNRRCKMTPDVIGKADCEHVWDKMFIFILTISTFNIWLSSVGLSKTFELHLLRGDEENLKQRPYSIILLYDSNQIGFLLDSETRVLGTFEEVIPLCILHLQCLAKRGLCRHIFQVKQLLMGTQ